MLVADLLVAELIGSIIELPQSELQIILMNILQMSIGFNFLQV